MPESNPVLAREAEPNTNRFLFYCPACECSHFFQVSPCDGPQWEWNGDMGKPFVRPSIRVRSGPGMTHICHFHITDGQIEYCNDCTHELNGQTVPMVTWDEA